MPEKTSSSRVMVLMFTDLVDSSALKVKFGDNDYVQYIAQPHNAIFRRILSQFPGSNENNFIGDGFLATFDRVGDAVNAALLFHHALRSAKWQRDVPQTRIGIHLGESVLYEGNDADGQLLASHAADMCARVMNLGTGGQTLLTRAAFDNARQYVRSHPNVDGADKLPQLDWLAHGRYLFKGKDEPMEVFEVGAVGHAPLQAPQDSNKARRAVNIEEEPMLGWRPATGLPVPGRPGWIVAEKLGEGGFGEVWLARHERTKQTRVFKFCFDADRLRSFKRELTLFRLIREALGKRDDIAELREVRLDEPPFYLESEHVEEGNLLQWSDRQGGIDKVPVEQRIDILAQTARALAAAHSLGIIHKDLKPSNIFVREKQDGTVQPVLADFGIGAVADRAMLEKHGVTAAGFTETVFRDPSSRSGTRLYAPPESLTGQPGSTRGDMYALGVLLYQLLVGDFTRPLATGWDDQIDDEVLRGDIRDCVEGDPSLRLDSATELAERLETLDRRRTEFEANRRAAQQAAETARRLRLLKVSLAIAAVILVIGGGLGILSFVQWQRAERNAQAAKQARDQAEAINHFLTEDLLAVARPEELGKDVSVKTALDTAAKKIDSAFADQPLLEAGVRLSIGETYCRLGLHDEADVHLRRALSLRREHLGPLNPDTLTAEHAFAFLLMRRGERKEAITAFRRTFEARRKVLGAEHPDTLKTMSDLGGVLWSNAEFDESESLLRLCLEIRRRVLDPDDPDILYTINDLALTLDSQGKYSEARPLYVECLEGRRRVLGPNHPLTLTAMNNWAYWLHYREGDLTKSETINRETLALRQKICGAEHVETSYSYHNLGVVLLDQNKVDEAIPLLHSAVEVRRDELPADNSVRISSVAALGRALMESGNLDEAEPMLREAVRDFKKSTLREPWWLPNAESALGRCLAKMGQHGEAESLLLDSYEHLSNDTKAPKIRVRQALERIVKFYEATGKPDEVAKWRDKQERHIAAPQ